MMRSLITFLLLVLTAGTFNRAASQVAQLKIGQAGIWQSKDSVNCSSGDSSVTYSLFVVNTGTADFQGAMLVEALYNQDTNVYVLATENVVNPLHPNDSMRFIIVDSIRAPYVGGDNILVIWPASTDPQSIATVDSGIVHLFIENCPTANVPEPRAEDRFLFWPNPAHDFLHLRYLEQRELFESVRISDISGKEILLQIQSADELDLSSLQPGIYLLQVRYRDGLNGNFRLIRE